MFIYFSFSSGLAHRYYFATMAPYIAGLVGILYFYFMENAKGILPILFALTAAGQIYIHSIYGTWLMWLLYAVFAIFIIVFILIIFGIRSKWNSKWLTIMLCSLLILPSIWSATPIIYGENSSLPITGPELIDARTNNNAYNENISYSELSEFLIDKRDGETFIAMVNSSMNGGSQLILESGEAVMCIGGFNGSDNILSLDEFIQMIDNNDVQFALLQINQNNNQKNSQNSDITNWISKNCKQINRKRLGRR